MRRTSWKRSLVQLAMVVLATAGLAGCGVVALPFRATGAVVRAVPVVGGVAAAPLEATGDVID